MSEPIRLGRVGRRPAVLIPAFGGLFAHLARWRERRRGRIALAELDRRMLADIGIDIEAARRESRKPFWL